ncbi:MAG: hypothetical protein JWM09_1478 [Francisellaceae bacterium]|nr:hypothetical protein [Francisellaceae bacterium]
MFDKITPSIAIMGLGYVGLPLAVNLARFYKVTGFDINEQRIKELLQGFDKTHEIEEATLQASTLQLSFNVEGLSGHDIYIVTVPTPINTDNTPDLTPLKLACEILGKFLRKNTIVVFESTVYPGVTEEYCGPLLEKHSQLKSGVDFFLGYSPERINPGDKTHTLNVITKIVAGQTPAVTNILEAIYGSLNNNNIHVAPNIKTAEAAKVIENAQRDINIAFINEISIIMNKLGLSIYEVLEAAKTKWNFLNFTPGLVGGHCIGVDPYYLAECAQMINHDPAVILAGRSTNELMADFIAEQFGQCIKKIFGKESHLKILILGLTFKENVPDIRNTKIVDLIQNFTKAGFTIEVHDPLANSADTEQFLNLKLLKTLEEASPYHAVLGAVAHQAYLDLDFHIFERLLLPKGIIGDLKNMWPKKLLPQQFNYWSL